MSLGRTRLAPLALPAVLLLAGLSVLRADDSVFGGGSDVPGGARSWDVTVEIPPNDSDPVAVINGIPISKADFVQRLVEWHGPTVLDEMITRVLVDQEMKRLGVTNTPEEVNQRIEIQIKLAREDLKQQSGGQMSLEDFLKSKGESLDTFRQLLFNNENFQKQIILEKMVEYSMQTEEQVEVQHIVVENEAKARELHERLHKGADFAKLAQENSDDQLSGSQGGKMLPFVFGLSPMGIDFDSVAFKLKDGQLSDVVRTQRGFHVIRRLGSRPAKTAPYSEIKDQVWQALTNHPASKRVMMAWLFRMRWQFRDKVDIKLKRK